MGVADADCAAAYALSTDCNCMRGSAALDASKNKIKSGKPLRSCMVLCKEKQLTCLLLGSKREAGVKV